MGISNEIMLFPPRISLKSFFRAKLQSATRGIVLFLCAFIFALSFAGDVYGQEFEPGDHGVWRVQVINILADEVQEWHEMRLYERVQTLEVKVLDGPRRGSLLTVQNDFFPLGVGDKFFLNYFVNIHGEMSYMVQEPDRRSAILFFVGLFVLVVLAFGKLQGLRSLAALALSIGMLFGFLFPQLLAGASPPLVSGIFAIAVLFFAIYITHGVNRASTAALLGTIVTILGTILLADFAVTSTKISGFAQEASVYLHIDAGGMIDFQGLLLGAIIIGVLGMLDDIAITQAVAVQELSRAAPHLARKEVYQRALRIGKEHVGALVNSLALAYAGAALPLLLLFYGTESPILMIINREMFATEIIRTVVGSIGIILAVPITTFIAALMLVKKAPLAESPGGDAVTQGAESQSSDQNKDENIKPPGHSHSHLHSHLH